MLIFFWGAGRGKKNEGKKMKEKKMKVYKCKQEKKPAIGHHKRTFCPMELSRLRVFLFFFFFFFYLCWGGKGGGGGGKEKDSYNSELRYECRVLRLSQASRCARN